MALKTVVMPTKDPMTLEAFEERLNWELEVIDYRATMVWVAAKPSLGPAVDELFARVLVTNGLKADQVIRYQARQDEEGLRQLLDLNSCRDIICKTKRLIWLQGSSAAEMRFLMRAYDLYSFGRAGLWPNFGVEDQTYLVGETS